MAAPVEPEVWHHGDPRFHQGEFWDQSALCGLLALRGELSPDVLAGKRIAEKRAEAWYSRGPSLIGIAKWRGWQGGPRVRETQHLRVGDGRRL